MGTRESQGIVIQVNSIVIGDKVKINIPERKWGEWARGAAECMNGKTGEVEAIKNRVLVKFDSPAPPWHSHQLPPMGFWFDFTEVEVVK